MGYTVKKYDLTKRSRSYDKAIEYLHMAARQFEKAGDHVASMEIDMVITKRDKDE